MKSILMCACGIALIISCSNPPKVIEYTIEDVVFDFEGPLYAGPNTAQAEIAIDVDDLLSELEMTSATIHGATLKTARIESEDGPFSGIQSFVVQFAGTSSNMVQAAVLNPVPADTIVHLNPSREAALRDLVREKQFYALLDADIANDTDSSFTLFGTFTFLIEVK